MCVWVCMCMCVCFASSAFVSLQSTAVVFLLPKLTFFGESSVVSLFPSRVSEHPVICRDVLAGLARFRFIPGAMSSAAATVLFTRYRVNEHSSHLFSVASLSERPALIVGALPTAGAVSVMRFRPLDILGLNFFFVHVGWLYFSKNIFGLLILVRMLSPISGSGLPWPVEIFYGLR